MPHRITILPSGRCFESEGDDTILQAALDAGLQLPYGCRNGACGACKGRVASGRIDRGEFQEQALSAADVAAGHALLCCSRALSDLSIECPEVGSPRGIAVKTLPCRVQRLELLAPDVMAVDLVLPASERLQFVAGQYIDILLKDGRRRSFSLANAPHDDACLQLHVRRIAGGYFTGHVFETMRERDILRLEGPHGRFCLREDDVRPVILVAGGTGFAPLKSMIEDALHRRLPRAMTLYWGARDRAGLYAAGLAESWRARGVGFVPVLSEPTAGDRWTGRAGLVHDAVLADLPDLSGYQAYVCGTPAMVEAAHRDFVRRGGLKEEDFIADSFSFAAEPSPT